MPPKTSGAYISDWLNLVAGIRLGALSLVIIHP